MALLARAKHELQWDMYVERVLHLATNFVEIRSTPAGRQDFNLEHRKMLKERLQFKVIRARVLRLQRRGRKLNAKLLFELALLRNGFEKDPEYTQYLIDALKRHRKRVATYADSLGGGMVSMPVRACVRDAKGRVRERVRAVAIKL
ncbi:hypothetical protein BV898_15761 [Hypsibius exemplaris]|uniref:Uncharacterized protein n=1 Tax=Hypsibius exemplaris TaxID=2072580 RepID=A0A9X6NDE5_HYPEX|nr:hypothetical protein BV898_15761 [Hypsibius exemplaris]